MDHKILPILAFLSLVLFVQGVSAIQTFDCYPGYVQNISPKDMGGLQTVYVYNGSVILVDGAPWRDAVTGKVPPVGWPGSSTGNVTNGSHSLKISLKGFHDFEATVNICKQGITEVKVHQVSLESTTALPDANPKGSPSVAATTVPFKATTKASGFDLIIAISAVATIFIIGKDSFR
jgi:hypothetical protein